MWRIGRVLALLLGLTAPLAALGQDALLDQARDLLSKQRGAEAYALLNVQADARAGDPAFDYLLGVAALDAGKPAEAVIALERVLDIQPDNAEARAEVGRAYYELGERQSAKREFEAVRARPLPQGVTNTIDRYLSAIETRFAVSHTQFRSFVEMGLGYDSNVNGATDDSQVAVPALGGLVVTLDPGGVEQSSGIWSLGGGFQFASPVRANLNVYGGVDVTERLAINASDFSTQYMNGTVGLHALHGVDQFRLAAQGQKFLSRGNGQDPTGELIRGDRDLAGLTAQWQRTLNPANQITAFGQYAMLQYPDQGVRNANRYSGGLGWGHAFGGDGKPALFTSLYGGTEDQVKDWRDDIGNDFVGLRLGGQYAFGDRTLALGSFTYQHTRYGADDPLFLERRQDDYFEASAGVRWAYDKTWSVYPELRYTHNGSTLAINEYERVEAIVYLRTDF